MLPDGTKVPPPAPGYEQTPEIITEIDGQRYVVDENGVLVRPPAPEIPIYREHETPPVPVTPIYREHETPSVPVTPIYRVYDNDDFVPIDSPLGQGLSRPTGEFRPDIDGKYEPVYDGPAGIHRKIIGYRRIYPGPRLQMLDFDKLPQSIKERLEISATDLKDIKNF